MLDRFRRQGVERIVFGGPSQADAVSELAAVTAQLAAAQAQIARMGTELSVQTTLRTNAEANERRLTVLVERYGRELKAEQAEVARLNGELADATAEDPEQPGDDGAYWKAKWQEDRRNVTAMADELARLRAGRRWSLT